MSASEYIHGALDDIDTTARRIPIYVADGQPTMAAYAHHVVHGRFAEIALLTHLHSLDPELADRLAVWIGEVQADKDKLSEVLSTWATEAFSWREFTVFGKEEA